MHVIRYDVKHKAQWDDFVRKSKNGTFLLQRDYMDYHANRFNDHSLIVLDESKNNVVALLPANLVEDKLISHQGLTYGGLVVDANMTQPNMMKIFPAVLEYLFEEKIHQLFYKTIPRIYPIYPAEEDLYALFVHHAVLERRDVLTVIEMSHRLPFQSRRTRQLKKTSHHNLLIKDTQDYNSAWNLLEQNLSEKHHVAPVHNREEILLLAHRFPKNIRLYGCYDKQQLLAGVVVYETPVVAHFQYVFANHDGRSLGALDWLFADLIERVYSNKKYIDFGISNEQNGRYLNHGLIEFKEGFGGRSIAHDYYRLDIDKA